MDAAFRSNPSGVTGSSPTTRPLPPSEPVDGLLEVAANMGDDALAEAIDRDVADRLVRGLPVPLSRYLATIGDCARHPLALDAAIDGALRSLVASGSALPGAVQHLASEHPDLRRVIESTATISMIFGPSGAAHDALEGPVRERPLPSRFGKALPDGKGRYELIGALGER